MPLRPSPPDRWRERAPCCRARPAGGGVGGVGVGGGGVGGVAVAGGGVGGVALAGGGVGGVALGGVSLGGVGVAGTSGSLGLSTGSSMAVAWIFAIHGIRSGR